MTADLPDAAITAELRDKVARALHDADRPECHCDGVELPWYKRQAEVALAAAAPALRAQGAAAAYGGHDVQLAIEAARTTGRAQGAATERARLLALARQRLAEAAKRSEFYPLSVVADLLDGDDG